MLELRTEDGSKTRFVFYHQNEVGCCQRVMVNSDARSFVGIQSFLGKRPKSRGPARRPLCKSTVVCEGASKAKGMTGRTMTIFEHKPGQ